MKREQTFSIAVNTASHSRTIYKLVLLQVRMSTDSDRRKPDLLISSPAAQRKGSQITVVDQCFMNKTELSGLDIPALCVDPLLLKG